MIRPRAAPFARASEEPYRRRTTDGVRVGVALVLVLLMARDSAHSSVISKDVFRFFNDLPGGLRPTFEVLYRLAALWAAAIVATAALVARRWRLARDLLVAALLAWLLARGLGIVLADGFRNLHVVVRSGDTPGFPSVRLALVVAVIGAASPFLTRGVRRVGWVAALLLVPAELYLGVAIPRSLTCAFVLGWGVAALVHLVFGSPGGRPTVAQVERALVDLGHPVTEAHLAEHQPGEHALVLARDEVGGLLVKVLGRDETDARLLSKAWRFLWFKDSGPTLHLTRAQEVQHNAYVALLARDAGARVPAVLAAGTGGVKTALLVERDVEGIALSTLTEVEDALLADTWAQVAHLQAGRIAHGRLNTAHVRVTSAQATIVSFGHARPQAQPDELSGDVAELLVTTSVLVGNDRAVRAAVAALGPEAVAAALKLVQPASLTRQGRQLAGAGPGSLNDHLGELRETAARAAGCEVPELEQLQRIRPANLALAVGTLVGVGALLGSVGDPEVLGDTLRHARPGLLAMGFVCSMLTTVGFALALAGAIPRRLPFWPNVKLQSAGVFSNLALPLGSQALQVRFLQRQGVDGGTAVAAGGLISIVAATGTQVAMLAVALQAAPQRIHTADIPRGTVETTLGLLTGGVLLATAVVLGVPWLRRRVLPPVTRGVHSLVAVLRSPRQLALLVGGNVLANVLYVLCLTFTLASLGSHPSIWSLMAINLGVTVVAALVPFPGGGTAVSSVGLSAAIAGLGVPQAVAVGAVLLHQLLTMILPSVPGWFALRSLLHHDDL